MNNIIGRAIVGAALMTLLAATSVVAQSSIIEKVTALTNQVLASTASRLVSEQTVISMVKASVDFRIYDDRGAMERQALYRVELGPILQASNLDRWNVLYASFSISSDYHLGEAKITQQEAEALWGWREAKLAVGKKLLSTPAGLDAFYAQHKGTVVETVRHMSPGERASFMAHLERRIKATEAYLSDTGDIRRLVIAVRSSQDAWHAAYLAKDGTEGAKWDAMDVAKTDLRAAAQKLGTRPETLQFADRRHEDAGRGQQGDALLKGYVAHMEDLRTTLRN